MDKIDLLLILCIVSVVFNLLMWCRLRYCENIIEVHTDINNHVANCFKMQNEFNIVLCKDINALSKATGVRVGVNSSPTGGHEAEAEHERGIDLTV